VAVQGPRFRFIWPPSFEASDSKSRAPGTAPHVVSQGRRQGRRHRGSTSVRRCEMERTHSGLRRWKSSARYGGAHQPVGAECWKLLWSILTAVQLPSVLSVRPTAWSTISVPLPWWADHSIISSISSPPCNTGSHSSIRSVFERFTMQPDRYAPTFASEMSLNSTLAFTGYHVETRRSASSECPSRELVDAIR
jgi:hypothetical protein